MSETLDQRQEAFLSQLTPTERQLFHSYRRSGLPFGQAEAALASAKRRMAKQAKPATRPTPRPTGLSAPAAKPATRPAAPATRPATTVSMAVPRPVPEALTPFQRWARDHGKPTHGTIELSAQDVTSLGAACRCAAGAAICF